jgi:Fe(3+) dicitrate transport protein
MWRGIACAACVAATVGAVPLSAQPVPAARVSGVVHGAEGRPLAGARVELVRPADAGAAAVTSGDGRFTLRVPAGADGIRLRATAPGHAPAEAAAGAGAADIVIRLEAAVHELSPLAVVGTTPAALRAVPGAARVVSEQEVRMQRPTAAHEVLRRTSGVHVQDEDGLGLNVNMGIRGLNPRRSARVLLLEDGVPIHLGPYADPTAHYQPPAEVLAAVEIVKGAGQIRHGPQTVGGVVNYIRRPAGTRSVLTLGGGDRGRRSAHLTLGRAIGEHGVALSLTHRATEGARRGWTHRADDAALHGRLRLGATGTLALKGGWYEEDSRFGETGLTQAEFEQDPFGNPSPEDLFLLRRLAAQAAYTVATGARTRFVAVAYAQDIDRTSWRQANSSRDRFGDDRYAERFGCSTEAASHADCGFQSRPRHYRFYGIEPRLEAAFGSATLDAGVRLHQEEVDRRQYLGARPATLEAADQTRHNRLSTTARSAYLRARLPLGGLALSPGLRLEDVASRNVNVMASAEQADRYTQLLPGLGAAWQAAPAITAFAGAHRGFAPPRPADIFSPAPGASLVRVDPEVSWNLEAGLRLEPAIGLVLEATAFRIRFDNQIVDGALAGSGQRFINAGATLHQGLEFDARYVASEDGRLRPVAALSWTEIPRAEYLTPQLSSVDGESSVLGRRVPYAPRRLWNFTAGAAGGASSAVLRVDHTGEQFADDLNTRPPSADGQRGALPAYTVLGVTLNHRLAGAGAVLFVTGENLTGRLYITQRQEGIMVGMPRRFAAGVEWVF